MKTPYIQTNKRCASDLFFVVLGMTARAQRTDSSSDRLSQHIFGSKDTLSETEANYLRAAESGDLQAIQKAVNDHNVNINCLDYLGRSALELAVVEEHTPVIEYLLTRSNIQCIEDAFLVAIGKDNVRICEIILNHPLYKNNRVKLDSTNGFYQKDTENPRFTKEITPIVLAAQRNNYYLVQLLLMKGAKITEPHDYFCKCVECSNQRNFDSVKYSRSRLNTYRALASPAYVSLSSDDPILTAFRLSHQLEQLTDVEKEYKVGHTYRVSHLTNTP